MDGFSDQMLEQTADVPGMVMDEPLTDGYSPSVDCLSSDFADGMDAGRSLDASLSLQVKKYRLFDELNRAVDDVERARLEKEYQIVNDQIDVQTEATLEKWDKEVDTIVIETMNALD